MAKWLKVGAIKNKKNGGVRACFFPEYVSKGVYSYDNLIDLHTALTKYLENQPKNEQGYPEDFNFVTKHIEDDLKEGVEAGRIKQDSSLKFSCMQTATSAKLLLAMKCAAQIKFNAPSVLGLSEDLCEPTKITGMFKSSKIKDKAAAV